MPSARRLVRLSGRAVILTPKRNPEIRRSGGLRAHDRWEACQGDEELRADEAEPSQPGHESVRNDTGVMDRNAGEAVEKQPLGGIHGCPPLNTSTKRKIHDKTR